MMIEVLKSKLHCVTVTEANLHYMGSITIDEDLLDAAGMARRCRLWIITMGSAWKPILSKVNGVRDASVSMVLQHERCRLVMSSSSFLMP